MVQLHSDVRSRYEETIRKTNSEQREREIEREREREGGREGGGEGGGREATAQYVHSPTVVAMTLLKPCVKGTDQDSPIKSDPM